MMASHSAREGRVQHMGPAGRRWRVQEWMGMGGEPRFRQPGLGSCKQGSRNPEYFTNKETRSAAKCVSCGEGISVPARCAHRPVRMRAHACANVSMESRRGREGGYTQGCSELLASLQQLVTEGYHRGIDPTSLQPELSATPGAVR